MQKGKEARTVGTKGKGSEVSGIGKQGKGVTQFKTMICRFWQQGICNRGQQCTFAHGQQELTTTHGGKKSTGKTTSFFGGKPTGKATPIGAQPGWSTGLIPWPSQGRRAPPPPPQEGLGGAGGGGPATEAW